MASSPITPWQTHGGEMEIVTDFIFLSSKITVDSDCSHEIKRHLLLERKAMTNLNSVLKKQKHHFVVKGSSSQSCGFSSSHVWMWELGIKKTECPRIDALELWCWRRLLRVPWTARRWNQSVLKEINPEHSLEGLMLNEAQAPIIWPLDTKSWLIRKASDAGKDWRQEKGATEDEMVGGHH